MMLHCEFFVPFSRKHTGSGGDFGGVEKPRPIQLAVFRYRFT